MACQQLQSDGACNIAATIDARAAHPSPEQCAECLACVNPATINRVTVRLASANAPGIAQQFADVFYPLADVIDGCGVGTELFKLLATLEIRHKKNCDCTPLALEMNRLGPAGCRENRAALVARMQANSKNYGWADKLGAAIKFAQNLNRRWAWKFDFLDPLGSLLDEAIRRADDELPEPIAYPSIELPADGVDIFLPLGPDSCDNNIETRLALRSIFANLTGWRTIYVVGTIPTWLRQCDRVRPIPMGVSKGPKAWRIADKVCRSIRELGELSSTFAFWNDDFVISRPYDIRKLPPYFKGKLSEGGGGYRLLLSKTRKALSAAKLPIKHFDIHTPILYSAERFLALQSWWDRSRKDGGYVVKSIYGNVYHAADAVTTRDCKLLGEWPKRIDDVFARRWVFSYGDAAIKSGLGKYLLERFPIPSPAE